MSRALYTALAFVAVTGCAKAQQGDGDGGVADIDGGGDDIDAASCGEFCDQDNDGVDDPDDDCADTPAGEVVNGVGCSDAQVDPTLVDFPPFGLTWTPTGDLGRAGGLIWTYVGIQRADLFHIYWVFCDDPATPCGVSLDGPIDEPFERWQYNAPGSVPSGGVLAFSNTVYVDLADLSTLTLAGRLTVTIRDDAAAAIPFETLTALGVTGRDGEFGAEILGTGYVVTMLAEVYDTATSTWTPYLDYYDAAPTADPGPSTYVSIGGSFYGE